MSSVVVSFFSSPEDAELSWDINSGAANLLHAAQELDRLAAICHTKAVMRGWWHTKEFPMYPGKAVTIRKLLNIGERYALLHSEVSEAVEAVRKDLTSDHIPQFTGEEEELADVLIRLFDYAGAKKLRLTEAFLAKIAYNAVRVDHSVEHREGEGGKKF